MIATLAKTAGDRGSAELGANLKREHRGCQVPFYPGYLPTRETTVLPILQEGLNERGKSQRARTATLGRREDSAASMVIWVETNRAGRSGYQW